jgi:uncharacterized protein (DUF58 family)
VLDTRAEAHRGSGPASSFEYAVSATASIGAHLAGLGFTVRLLTDDVRAADATWHDRGISGPVEVQMLLESLAVIGTSTRTALSATMADRNSAGLLVAILGDCSDADIASVSGLRSGATRSLAILLDTPAWSHDKAGTGSMPVERQARALRTRGWTVAVAGPSQPLPSVWQGFGATAKMPLHPTPRVVEQTGPAA